MSNPSKGKMWADIVVMFFLALTPALLSVICFGAAGLLFIVHDITPVVERLLTVGTIMVGVTFVFGFSRLAHNSGISVDEEDEDVVDN